MESGFAILKSCNPKNPNTDMKNKLLAGRQQQQEKYQIFLRLLSTFKSQWHIHFNAKVSSHIINTIVAGKVAGIRFKIFQTVQS